MSRSPLGAALGLALGFLLTAGITRASGQTADAAELCTPTSCGCAANLYLTPTGSSPV